MNELTNKASQQKQVEQQIHSAVNSLAQFLATPDDKFDVRQTLSNIMALIRVHPQQSAILSAEDIGTMVASLRERYGIAIVKAEKKGAGKSKAKKEQLDLGDLLNDTGFDKL